MTDERTIRALEGESLTLDTEALTRAANALSGAIGGRLHLCDEWDEGDGCTICWEVAGDVLRAAEDLRCCPTCNGTGNVGTTAAVCCDECGGNGLALLTPAADKTCPAESQEGRDAA